MTPSCPISPGRLRGRNPALAGERSNSVARGAVVVGIEAALAAVDVEAVAVGLLLHRQNCVLDRRASRDQVAAVGPDRLERDPLADEVFAAVGVDLIRGRPRVDRSVPGSSRVDRSVPGSLCRDGVRRRRRDGRPAGAAVRGGSALALPPQEFSPSANTTAKTSEPQRATSVLGSSSRSSATSCFMPRSWPSRAASAMTPSYPSPALLMEPSGVGWHPSRVIYPTAFRLVAKKAAEKRRLSKPADDEAAVGQRQPTVRLLSATRPRATQGVRFGRIRSRP